MSYPSDHQALDRLSGTCRCGQVHLEITAQPILTSACHCRGCQRMSASAYSLTAMIPAGAFHVRSGEPVKGGLQGPDLEHFFCPHCKTWMFTRIVGMDDFVNVRPTMFDDSTWSRPFIETMTSEKLPWTETPARYSYVGFPPLDEFSRLLEEFASYREDVAGAD